MSYQLHADDSLSVFLDVGAHTTLVANQGQKGVSSFAFHPDYLVPAAAGSGRFYTASAQSAASGVTDLAVCESRQIAYGRTRNANGPQSRKLWKSPLPARASAVKPEAWLSKPPKKNGT